MFVSALANCFFIWVIAQSIGNEIVKRANRNAMADRLEVGQRSFSETAIAFWVGIGTLIAILPALNFLFPLANRSVFYTILSVSAILLIRDHSLRKVRGLRDQGGIKLSQSIYLGVGFSWIVLIIVQMYNLSFLAVANYDSYLYHLARIDYFASEKFVFGIGNLHSRFAFSPNHFALSAFFEGGPWGVDGFRLVNPFLAGVALAQASILFTKAVLGLFGLVQVRIQILDVLFPAGITLTTVWFAANGYSFMASPSPDFAASLFMVISFTETCRFLSRPTYGSFLTSGILTAAAVAYRPISIVNFLIVALFGIAVLRSKVDTRFTLRNPIRKVLVIATPPFLIIVQLFVAVAGSGWLFYPGFHPWLSLKWLPWTLPYSSAVNDSKWIKSWARAPEAYPDDVLGSWEWITYWWQRNGASLSANLWILVGVALISALIVHRSVRHLSVRVSSAVKFKILLIVLCGLSPALLWFFSAPDLRFGYGAIICVTLLPIAVAGLFSGLHDLREQSIHQRQSTDDWNRIVTVFVGLFLVLIPMAHVILPFERLGSGTPFLVPSGQASLTSFDLDVYSTGELVDILQPVEGGDQCGRVKWCTPYPFEGLDVSKKYGFYFILQKE